MLYNLTIAMRPAHKETARFHPLKFCIGFIMHIGVIISLAGVLLLAIHPPTAYALLTSCQPVIVVGLLSGIYLFVRRIFSKQLRSMSNPDDYLAILATFGLLASALIWQVGSENVILSLGYSVLFFIYLPLGKLRHAAFFFATRIDVGRRLGYRGVYPPAPVETE